MPSRGCPPSALRLAVHANLLSVLSFRDVAPTGPNIRGVQSRGSGKVSLNDQEVCQCGTQKVGNPPEGEFNGHMTKILSKMSSGVCNARSALADPRRRDPPPQSVVSHRACATYFVHPNPVGQYIRDAGMPPQERTAGGVCHG